MKKIKILVILLFLIVSLFITSVVINAENNNEEYLAKAYIDYPYNNSVGGNIVISGWIMTNDIESTIKVYVDNSEVEILSQNRYEREDVLQAIKGYGTVSENPTPGIKLVLNSENIVKGKHKLTLKIISRNGNVLYEKMQEFEYQEEKAKTYIDSPLNDKTIINDSYKIEGWVMSNDIGATIKVFVDDMEQNTKNFKRIIRDDVIRGIKGYGDKFENPNPGFEFYLDTSKFKDGEYALKIQVLSEKGDILTEISKQVVIEKYKAKTYIDYPNNNSLAGNLEFEGWMMTNDQNSIYKLFIDDKEQKDIEFERVERTDVLNAIKGYGTEKENPLPGIKCKINTENIKIGKHNIALKVYSREGKILSQQESSFILENAKARICMDEPQHETVSSNMKIEGWLMSNDKNATIKVYVDEIEQTITNYERVKRTDVINAIKGYGTEKENPLPGFKADIDLSNLSNGEHILKIDVVSENGKIIITKEKVIFLDKYRTKMYIDSPIRNQVVKTTLKLEGWIMSSGENPNIKVYIDDKKIENIEIKRRRREDVINAIKGYGTEKENPTPGFETEIDTSHLLEGKHTLKILANVNEEETQKFETVDFIVNKYNTKIYIDEPIQNSTKEDTLKIGGWAMSELANKKIIVKIDNNIIENVTFKTRTDVINNVKECGGIDENPTPGFETIVDIKSYSKGMHNIIIQVYSNETNEVIKEQKQEIIFLSKIERETLTYGYSGAYLNGVSGGSELKCYKYGYGPNVLFATFCVHGFEDSWPRDGEVLVNIANKFYDRLIADQDYSLAEKWTIYIFPEVNPDGRRLGTTNYGPGRTTLYSEVGKGIDINRSWQTGNSYERFEGNRNYNGTAGFQAYEAKYLRDFILTHKTNIGQNVLIDLHGWENQLIGDESVCKYYKEQYPSCRTIGYGKYGSQYIISWARANIGAKVALVELPVAKNHSQVENMRLPDKYINATLNFLRGM